MEKVMNLCLLGILWALFSLPVITVGASTAALFQYTLRLTRDEEGYVWKSFWNAFKKNFVPATMVWAAAAAAACFWWQICTAVSFCLPRSRKMGSQGAAWKPYFRLFINNYLRISVDCIFKISVKKTIKDAFVMAMGNLYVSVTVLVIYALCAFLTWYFYRTVYDLVCIWQLSGILVFTESV